MSVESRSLGSSITEGDLEEARQRLLEHQYDHDDQTEPVTETEPTLAAPHRIRLPPTPLRDGNYGSVSTLQSIQQKPAPRNKRYRIPLLILLVFDFGMVVFLSIICSEVRPSILRSSLVMLSPFVGKLCNDVVKTTYVCCSASLT